jgi:probable phosphomutase (TIGR03848 family)
MATVVLIRHGRSTANSSGILAGRLPDVRLDEKGRTQVEALAERLSAVSVVEAWSSPLERCDATATAALSGMDVPPELRHDDRFLECDYGEWQGRSIPGLAKESLWGVVQSHPSAAVFPGGESLVAMSQRMVSAVREHDARIEAEHGPDAVWLLTSHGDPIKAVLADALGMHLDLFQRIVVDPASASIVRYSGSRPYLLTSNSSSGDLGWLTSGSQHAATTSSGDAVPGGGAGHEDGTPDAARPVGA